MILGNRTDPIALIGVIFSTVFCLLVYRFRFRPDFKGVTFDGDFKKGILMILPPLIVYWIVNGIAMAASGTLQPKPLTLGIITTSVTAGFVEELSFRHGIISTMFKSLNKKEDIPKICLISSAVFGLFHAFNLFAGADPLHTAVQVVGAGCHGVLFAAVFMACGNLWPSILFHAVHDILAIAFTASVTESGVVSGGFSPADLVDLITCILVAVFAFRHYLATQHRQAIASLWQKKWNKEEILPVNKEE
ncbi:MAG: CPBP family intramembrane metalloprotease [Erysipelotrichaceae bacterium]|nr:CPBP family intramembrane metalloprotease [Erysipelotrichaceae bacterium]